ncbi:NADPH-dependent FMN reductase [Nocardioides ungokensis]|uniref:NADPH-dependent FMN reductase n=1 Tax=Nocardioides ungokensis TaxID=1643322 RepID=UPI001C60EB7E|nr:NAD(P)H-dependent oxidoreductase [Nocardioides ungokensis]
MTARVAVVVGNPKPASRTLTAALHVARELAGTEPDLVVDLADLGPALLDWQDPTVAALVAAVGEADLVVVASPTYKATYTGLLKLFLDRFATDGLRGLAVPLMLGAGPAHALARSSRCGPCSPRSAAPRCAATTCSTAPTTTSRRTPAGSPLSAPSSPPCSTSRQESPHDRHRAHDQPGSRPEASP